MEAKFAVMEVGGLDRYLGRYYDTRICLNYGDLGHEYLSRFGMPEGTSILPVYTSTSSGKGEYTIRAVGPRETYLDS